MPGRDFHNIPDLDDLTQRELEVLKLIADGYSLLEIAYKLQRSLKTIESHRLMLGRKLRISDRVDLTKIAIAKGLTTLTPRIVGGYAKRVTDEEGGQTQAGGPALHWIHQVSETVDRTAGLDMLKELTNALCKVCGLEHAGVSVISPDEEEEDYFSTMAYSRAGQIEDLISYAKDISPCAHALDDGFYLCESGVAKDFPDNDDMVKANVEFYLGCGLQDRAQHPIGVVWVADGKAGKNSERIKAVINHFKPRVSATVRMLHQTNQTLRLCESREKKIEQLIIEVERLKKRIGQIA